MITIGDAPWWPIISALGSLFFFPIALLIGGILRAIFIKKIKQGE